MRKYARLFLFLCFVLGLVSAENLTAATPTLATFTVNSLGDDDDISPGDGNCATSTGDCTLRAAIRELVSTAGAPHTIMFSVAGVINVSSPFIDITQEIHIDAITGNGAANCPTGNNAGNLLVEIDGGGVASRAFEIQSQGSNSSIRGLAIGGFTSQGIRANNVDKLVIQCNIIGLRLNGSTLNGNGSDGMYFLSGGANIQIGGTAFADRNIISGNGGHGIRTVDVSEFAIEGNIIGLNAQGNAARANGGAGIFIADSALGSSTLVRVGGATANARNIISGNQASGIITVADEVTIQNNTIGANASGLVAIPNQGDGILINTESADGLVDSNVIVGNMGNGIDIDVVTDFTISNNLIGLGIDGATVLGNGENGIFIDRGFSAGEAAGVNMRTNRIYGNTLLGIDLESTNINGHVTANDATDNDTGPNGLQNFPILSLVQASGRVVGDFDAAPGTYAIDIYQNDSCDPSDNGEGQTLLGSFSASESGGMVSFDVVIGTAPTAAKWITTLATDANGNTSEFGPCYPFMVPTAIDLGTVSAETPIHAQLFISIATLLIITLTTIGLVAWQHSERKP